MLAVQIAEEFSVWVCYVTLALTPLAPTPSRLHICIHNASGKREAAEQIAADR